MDFIMWVVIVAALLMFFTNERWSDRG